MEDCSGSTLDYWISELARCRIALLNGLLIRDLVILLSFSLLLLLAWRGVASTKKIFTAPSPVNSATCSHAASFAQSALSLGSTVETTTASATRTNTRAMRRARVASNSLVYGILRR